MRLNHMSRFSHTRELRKWAGIGFACIAVLLIMALNWPYLKRVAILLSDQAAIRAIVQSFGILGPVAIFLMHSLQIIIAAIPGHMIMVATGYIYGFWVGFAITF